jgi:hypothetical protein
LILEAEDLHKALKILNEGFLYNGIQHKNTLKFYGCYLNEVTFSTGFLNEEGHDKEEDEDKEPGNLLPIKKQEGVKEGVTY